MGEPQTLLDQVLDALRAHRTVAQDAGVSFVGVVGSVARGEAGTDSDIDVVFDVSGRLDYWKLGGVVADLEDVLGRRVDVVDRAMMRPENWAWMSRDLVMV